MELHLPQHSDGLDRLLAFAWLLFKSVFCAQLVANTQSDNMKTIDLYILGPFIVEILK